MKTPSPNIIDTDSTTAKEDVSASKVRSALSLALGMRPFHFDAFFEDVPTVCELFSLAKHRGKPIIQNVIFDLDGTLVAPYADVSFDVISKLLPYIVGGLKVVIYTNSPHTDRLNELEKMGICIAKTGIGKPALEGYKKLCAQFMIDPAMTAMIGDSPITDMPLVEENEKPFLALNILVKSIPPDGKLFESHVERVRAELFHAIGQVAVGVLKINNPALFRRGSKNDR